MATYPPRACLVCGKEFIPEFSGNVCCSKECKQIRIREQKTASDVRRGRFAPNDTDWLNTQYETLLQRYRKDIDFYEAEIERLKALPGESDELDAVLESDTDAEMNKLASEYVISKGPKRKRLKSEFEFESGLESYPAKPSKAKRHTTLDDNGYLPPARTCHDCGKPTNNYRCDACAAKWKKKHGVMGTMSTVEE